MLVTGTLLLSSSVAALNSTAIASRLIQSAPTWMLDWQLRNARQASVDAICREITRRHQANTLTAPDAPLLIESILTSCERASISWSPSISGAIESLELARASTLSDAEWSRVLPDMVLDVQLMARSNIREGSPLPVRAILTTNSALSKEFVLSASLATIVVDGELLPFTGRTNSNTDWPYFNNTGVRVFNDFPQFHLAVGDHDVTIEWSIDGYRYTQFSKQKFVGGFRRKQQLTLKVIAPDKDLLEPLFEPSPDELREKISVSNIGIRMHGIGGGSGHVDFKCDLPQEFPAAFDVFVLIPDDSGEPKPEHVLSFYMDSGVHYVTSLRTPYVEQVAELWARLADRPVADVLLKSNPSLIEHTLDKTKCWRGDILYKDVPIKILK